MKNKIEDLRNHLFATLEALRDEEHPMELDRARTIADVARVVVDSAKAETQFLQTQGKAVRGTGFIPLAVGAEEPTPPRQLSPAAPEGITRLRTCPSCGQDTRQNPCGHCQAPWSRVA